MKNTMQALDWAFKLDVLPESKLVAIYIATLTGMSGSVTIDETVAAQWCGFVSPAHRVPRVKDVRCALQSIPGINYDYVGDGKITITWEG